MGEWKALRGPLADRLAAAEATLARTDAGSALARMTGDTATLADRWADLDVDLRRRLITLVLDHVEISKPRKPGVLDPDRVEPIWTA